VSPRQQRRRQRSQYQSQGQNGQWNPRSHVNPSLLTQKCRILTRRFAVGFAFEAPR
jgi:hypothetical protein